MHGLGADVVVPWLEGAACDDVHFQAQEFLEVLGEADVIDKGGAWLEFHEQVQVAPGASLSPGDGAEHRDPMSPTIPRDREDLGAESRRPSNVSTSSAMLQR